MSYHLPEAACVVITGAGGGLGRALALTLAKSHRAHLVLSDRSLAAVQETAALAWAAGASSARAMACDVTKLADIEAMAAACDDVDLVINNAGVTGGGDIGSVPIDVWRKVIDVDLFGVINGCHVFVPKLRQQGHGRILNVSSAAGLLSAAHMGPYNVAKAAVIALSETLAAELEGDGLKVTVLCPTYFKTDIVKGGQFSSKADQELSARLIAHGTSPEFVAEAGIRAVEAGELYCLPMAEARWAWRLKRLLPAGFPRVARVMRTLKH